ncbi:hypothetical protein QTP81_03065 [Alteromonas sp. ASW11-36]|uniref:Uncharacterized protein n=1 Tax=Alteromonas arenosi TaxID=3055817 RepID=A0ABT7STR1_9ALTE|nr:hypothetical protein [Alteromonas sp. ASW11-36]MDM7859586.1 hypothetical protein [Alteromonas sp. ASW11-36]
MSNQFPGYSDKDGGFTFEPCGLVAVVRLRGACGANACKALRQHLIDFAALCKPKLWGYLSISPNAQATTLEAEDILVDVGRLAVELGCCVDAHCLNHPLILEQTRRVRKNADFRADMRDSLFSSEQQALEYIHKVLAKKNRNR